MGAGHAHPLYVHEHSLIHRLPPETKVAATVAFVVTVAITPAEAMWAFGVYAGLVAGSVLLARVRLRFVAARLVGVLPFVLFAFLLPFIATGPRVDVVGVEVSSSGLWGTWNIVAKAGIGAATSILLAATTEIPDILRGLSRLRVPGVLVSIASFMIRYLELIVTELGRMRTAMTARGHDARWLWQAKPIASVAGTLFVRSYERGERVYQAMLARGYSGTMPDLDRRRGSARDWMVTSVFPLAAVLTATAAFVTT